MTVIIGLGNPEREYKGSRHNAGFEVVNKFAFDKKININKAKFRAHIGAGMAFGEKLILVKPQTYMNRSGESARDVLKFYKLTPSDIIVAYDDVDIALGDIRVRANGSAGSHNGMKSMIAELGTEDFTRVRVGIGAQPEGWDLADYVLSGFSKNEFDAMVEGVTRATDAIDMILRENVTAAMNKYNVKNNAGQQSKQ